MVRRNHQPTKLNFLNQANRSSSAHHFERHIWDNTSLAITKVDFHAMHAILH